MPRDDGKASQRAYEDLLCLRTRQGDARAESELVRRFAPDVQRVCTRLHLSKEQAQEFHSYGQMALLSALKRFDLTRGVPLWAYARHRVRGVIIKELGKSLGLTSGPRKYYRRIWEAFDLLVALRNGSGTLAPNDLNAAEIADVIAIFRARFGFGILPKTARAVLESRQRCQRYDDARPRPRSGGKKAVVRY